MQPAGRRYENLLALAGNGHGGLGLGLGLGLQLLSTPVRVTAGAELPQFVDCCLRVRHLVITVRVWLEHAIFATVTDLFLFELWVGRSVLVCVLRNVLVHVANAVGLRSDMMLHTYGRI